MFKKMREFYRYMVTSQTLQEIKDLYENTAQDRPTHSDQVRFESLGMPIIETWSKTARKPHESKKLSPLEFS